MWGRVQGDLIITLLAPPPVTRLHRDTSPRAPVAPDISYSEHRYRGGGSSLVTELLQSRDYCRLRTRIPQFRHQDCDENNIQRRSILQPLHQCNEGFGCQRSLNSPSVKFIAKMGKYHDIADSLHSIKSEEAQLESINFQRVAIWVLADAQPWVCPSHPAQSTAAQHLAATSASSCHVPGSRGSDCRIMSLQPAWTCLNCLCYRVIPRLSQQLHGVAIAIIDYPDSIRNQDVPKIVNKHGKTVKNIFISGMVSSYVFRRIPSRVME